MRSSRGLDSNVREYRRCIFIFVHFLSFFTVRYVSGIDRRDAVSPIGPDCALQEISLAGAPKPRMLPRDS